MLLLSRQLLRRGVKGDEVTKGLDGLEPPATAPVDSGDGGAVSEPVDPAPETDAPVEVVTPES